MSASKPEFTTDHAVYRRGNAVIRGVHCTVYGDSCSVYGDHCIVWGNHCVVYGDHCIVYGDRCLVKGNHTQVNGRQCTVTGSHALIRHRSCNTAGAAWCTYLPENGVPITTVSSAGAIGDTSVVFDADGMTVTRGGVTQTYPMPSAAASSSSSAKKRSADDDDEPRKRPAVPVDHVVQKAVDGDKECQICMDNRVDACLEPCRHAALCVDCARALYFDADESRRACPICRKAFTRIEAIILS